MVYQNKMVVAVKVDGKILRETGDSVSIPFGSEYSILLKNLNSVRTLVKISIDGVDATDGTELVLEPNSSLDLERFIHNGNLDAGNKFKFIPRSKQIEKHRGIKSDDGLIRVEYKTERVVPKIEPIKMWWTWIPYSPFVWQEENSWTKPYYDINGGQQTNKTILRAAVNTCMMNCSTEPVMNMGITVPGSESSQKFYCTSPFKTHPQSEVIVLRLRGHVAGEDVQKAVTVNSKPKCSFCGTKNKSSNCCCVQCGAALKLI